MAPSSERRTSLGSHRSPHLQRLEAETIHIFREVAATFVKPVMLYSIGKDSAVLLHLAQKAFIRPACLFRSFHGDNVRYGLNRDLGFTEEDRVESIRRVAEVARLMADAGLIVLVSFISPLRVDRRMARGLMGGGGFVEVFLDTPFEECARRDPEVCTPRR